MRRERLKTLAAVVAQLEASLAQAKAMVAQKPSSPITVEMVLVVLGRH